jgi:hypothetical protein
MEDALRVLHLADEHLAGELERVRQIEAGGSVSDVFGLEPKLAAWKGEV